MGGDMDVRRVPAREAAARRWFDFLAAECTRRDGLLCFYDQEKSSRVLTSCQALARHLDGRVATSDSPASGRGREDEPCPFSLPAVPRGPG